MQAPFFRFDDVPSFPMAAGVTGQPVFGQGAMLNLARLDAAAVVAEHSHPHEQIGLVLEGSIELTVAGVTQMLGPMDGVVIPGGVVHSALGGPGGAVMLDVFQPPREDYRDRWTGQTSTP
jgi:quercetin dioxygenase-like cupin family protein